MNRKDVAIWPQPTVWLGLAFFVCIFPGCSDRERTLPSSGADSPPASEVQSFSDKKPRQGVLQSEEKQDAGREPAGSPVINVEQVRSLQRTVEECGGLVQLDGAGRPLLVDFVSPRAPASVEAFDQVVKTPTLKVLRLIGSRIPRERLAALVELRELTELVLQDAPVTDGLLAELAQRLPLTRLTLRNTPQVTDSGVNALTKLTNLTHLALIELPIEGRSLKHLAMLPRLRSFDLRQCANIGAEELRELAAAPELAELKLGGYQVDNRMLAAVVELPHLRSLTVEDASVDSTGLHALKDSQLAGRLESLAFVRCPSLDDDALALLKDFRKLRQLILKDLPLTGRFLGQMPWLENLETLVLSQTFVDEQSLAVLSRCRNLRRLELAQVPLTGGVLQTIGALSSLQVLDLSECGLTDEMVKPLKQLPHLRSLRLDGNPDLSPDTVRWLTSSISSGS